MQYEPAHNPLKGYRILELAKIRDIFRRNLLALIGARPLKQVAVESGVPYRTLSHMLSGGIPAAKNLSQIAKYLDVEETALFLDPDLLPKVAVREPDDEELIQMLSERLKAGSAMSPIKRAAIDRISALDDTQVRALLATFDLIAEGERASNEIEAKQKNKTR